jgi:hypothetical protein
MQQRSPIIFWLLLAATISLDLVFASWIRLHGWTERLELLILALVFGQLSVVCIWIVLSTQPVIYRCVVGAAAVPLAALAIRGAEPPLNYSESAALIAVHFAGSVLALGLLKLYMAYRSRVPTAAQFSMKHLFVLMTGIALMAAILGGSKLFRESWFIPSLLVANNVLIAVVALAFWFSRWHWVGRVAATLAVTLFVGWCLTFLREHLSGQFEIMNCIQALIVLAWLDWGEIIRRPSFTGGDDSEIAPANT